MAKVRINDLARELEVKSKAILDALTAVGVTEHKTHSSAVEEDVAVKVRRYLRGESEPEAPAAPLAPLIEEPAVAESLTAAPSPPAAEAETPAPAPVQTPAPPPPPTAAQPAPPPPAAVKRESRPEPRIHVLAPTAPAPPMGTPKMPVAPPRPTYRPPSQVKPVTPPAPPIAPPPPPTVTRPPAPVTPAATTTPRTYLPSTPPPTPTVRRTPTLNLSPSAPVVPGTAPPPSAPPVAGRRIIVPVAPNRPVYAAPARPLRPVTGQPIAGGPAPGRPIYQRPPAPGARPGPTGRAPVAPEGRRPMHPTRAGGRDLPPRGIHHREPRQKEGPQKFQPSARSMPAAPKAAVAEITISEGITVGELSERLGLRVVDVITKLIDRGHLVTKNQSLGIEIATQIAREFGAEAKAVTFEEEFIEKQAEPVEAAEAAGKLKGRAPVVTIMGHVDHGKTSLLDAIRETSVAAGEAGGITQHIGAYKVEISDPQSPAYGRSIVFIDTPGHAAFTRMRARGARVTDVVVLVVAADDGVMPRTFEAIDHAKAANVPLLVAINKVDKPDALPDRVKKQLADRGLQPEDWGGSTVMVNVSAKAGTNLNLLLEMVLLVSDLQELRADVDRPGQGTVLEAQLDRGRGPVARILVQNGTLRTGDTLIAGAIMGRVRAMFDDRGRPLESAGPSTPVEVLGLDGLPEAGDGILVVNDRGKAKQVVTFREEKAREAALARSSRLNLEALSQQLAAGDVKELNLIIKADVQGSEEVLVETLGKLGNDRVKVRVIHSGVGAITETDVLLASASNAVIIGFNVRPERKAADMAEQDKVDIRLHSIIYELTDEIKRAMQGLLEPTIKEVVQGRATVQQTFRIPRVGMIAGCLVREGRLARDTQVRIVRDGVVVYTSKLSSLRRFKDDVSEVRSGMECGVQVANYSDVKPGDVIEAFVTEKVAPAAV